MNTALIKKALLFTAGVGVGFVIGALIMKKRYDDWYFTPIETYEYKEVKDAENVHDVEPEPVEVEAAEQTSAAVNQAAYTAERTTQRRHYNTIVKDLNYDVEDRSTRDKENYKCELATREANSHGRNEMPYVITTEGFSEENDHYDKLTIYYYEDDDTLADENEEIIIDVTAIVGDDALCNFGEGSDDPEIVYVRNDKLQIDYEIIRLSKSYKETILGIREE